MSERHAEQDLHRQAGLDRGIAVVALSTTLDGGAGNDTLNCGDDNDLLIGGADGDIFVFTPDFGADVLSDFSPSQTGEVIRFLGIAALSAWAEVQTAMSIVGGQVAISYGSGNQITLTGITATNQLQAIDFVFV